MKTKKLIEELWESDAASALTNQAAREIERLSAEIEGWNLTMVDCIEKHNRKETNRDDYYNGAVTALSYAAQAGANLHSIVETMETMGVLLDSSTDESDMERFCEAYGIDSLKSAEVYVEPSE